MIAKNAVYLPAISEAYGTFGLSVTFPRPLPITPLDLNFLDPGCQLFHHPFALFSAGQGWKTNKTGPSLDMLISRDPAKTVVLADSGGFQIQQGTIKFNGDATTKSILKWMESFANHSMILDFPTGGIGMGTVGAHHRRLINEGHGPAISALNNNNQLGEAFNTCLFQTLLNNQVIATNRQPNTTRLLNVVQGRTERESKAWYDAVKGAGFEDWAFAGGHQSTFSMLLNRIFDLHNDGLLRDMRWIHVLGTSKPFAAAILTTIQNCIREHFNADIQISFDSATPFLTAVNHIVDVGFQLDRYDWKAQQFKLSKIPLTLWDLPLNVLAQPLLGKPASASRKGAEWAFDDFEACMPATAIGKHICIRDLFDAGSANMDVAGTAMLMNHNIEVYLQGFEYANKLLQSGEIKKVPNAVWNIDTLVRALFRDHRSNPHVFIREAASVLDRLSHA